MPIETVAGFFGEQILGIVVGAAAIALAPALVPKLQSAANEVQAMTSTALAEVNNAGTAMISRMNGVGERVTDVLPATVATVVQPVVDTSKSAYESTVTGAHWYFEQWSDLLAEACASVSPPSTMTVADVVGGLSTATVVSQLPGRARLHVSQLRRNNRLAGEVTEFLQSQPGINRVTGSSSTANVLIVYDQDRYSSLDSLINQLAG